MKEQNVQPVEIHYVKAGDYYLPDLELPKVDKPIGRYGRMREKYLREHDSVTYNVMLLSGELFTHLADMDEQAHERIEQLIRQMKEAEGVTEEMKVRDQLAWVGAMNNIRARAEEVVLQELVYAQ